MASIPSISAERRNRLQLYVYHHLKDRSNFEKALGELKEQFRDTPADHFRYWDLLQELGHDETAIKNATDFISTPRTSFQVIETADAFAKLGLTTSAINYLKNYAGAFGLNEQRFYGQASLLVIQEDWASLRRLALEIRTKQATSTELRGYSYFIDGLGAFHLGREAEARRAFSKIKDFSFRGSHLAVHVASNLWTLGFHQEAFDTLILGRARFSNSPAYWQLMMEISTTLNKGSLMLAAAENLYRLSPKSPQAQANYASLLISMRTQIDRAITLTFDLLSKDPASPVLQTNYAQALALSSRTSEATRQLESVDQSKLTAQEWHGFAFAWLTVFYQQEDPVKAMALANRIIPALPLPGDRRFYESILIWANEEKKTTIAKSSHSE